MYERSGGGNRRGVCPPHHRTYVHKDINPTQIIFIPNICSRLTASGARPTSSMMKYRADFIASDQPIQQFVCSKKLRTKKLLTCFSRQWYNASVSNSQTHFGDITHNIIKYYSLSSR